MTTEVDTDHKRSLVYVRSGDQSAVAVANDHKQSLVPARSGDKSAALRTA